MAGVLYEYVFSAGATIDIAKKCLLRSKKKPLPEDDGAPIVVVEDANKTELVELNDTQMEEKDEKTDEKAKLTEDNEKIE